MEIWKDIEGYEGYFQVSDSGNVRSLDRIIVDCNGVSKRIRGFAKKITINADGYRVVTLSKNGKDKVFFVHRLVAFAFIPNPNGYEFINHKDENKSNNNISNLEWCTCAYNNRYGTAPERTRMKIKELGQMCPVIQFSTEGVKLNEYESLSEASRKTGIILQNIWSAINGGEMSGGKWVNRFTAGGYKWELACRQAEIL